MSSKKLSDTDICFIIVYLLIALMTVVFCWKIEANELEILKLKAKIVELQNNDNSEKELDGKNN